MKIQDLQDKADGYLIQDVLRVTVREAGAVEMKPGYNNGPAEPNQRLRVSDETGTITAYLTGAQEVHNGDVLDICATRGQRGVSGATVKISKQGQRYIALYARGMKIAGVARQSSSAEDPAWFTGQQPASQPRPQARPQQTSLPMAAPAPSRRTSRQMEDWLSALTERIYVNLSDGLCKEASAETRLSAAQAMAVSISIAVGRGEIDFVPETALPPRSAASSDYDPTGPAEQGMDWGEFGEQGDEEAPF